MSLKWIGVCDFVWCARVCDIQEQLYQSCYTRDTSNIHPSITYTYSILVEPIPSDIGRKLGTDILDRLPVCHRATSIMQRPYWFHPHKDREGLMTVDDAY